MQVIISMKKKFLVVKGAEDDWRQSNGLSNHSFSAQQARVRICSIVACHTLAHHVDSATKALKIP